MEISCHFPRFNNWQKLPCIDAHASTRKSNHLGHRMHCNQRREVEAGFEGGWKLDAKEFGRSPPLSNRKHSLEGQHEVEEERNQQINASELC